MAFSCFLFSTVFNFVKSIINKVNYELYSGKEIIITPIVLLSNIVVVVLSILGIAVYNSSSNEKLLGKLFLIDNIAAIVFLVFNCIYLIILVRRTAKCYENDPLRESINIIAAFLEIIAVVVLIAFQFNLTAYNVAFPIIPL